MATFRAPSNPPLTDNLRDIARWLLNLAEIVRLMLTGKLNATGTVTLDKDEVATVLTDPRLGIDSTVAFDPMTANAAAELYGASMYVPTADRANGAWTITHANNSQTDRTFRYLIIG